AGRLRIYRSQGRVVSRRRGIGGCAEVLRQFDQPVADL
ncbi:MAG: hypothetical protein, partial [Olavius algarvensis Gamma 3 endosymbiont]